MNWEHAPLGEVAPARATRSPYSDSETVWILNLDQIEPNTGTVLEKLYAPAEQAGNSTHGFDQRHVLYSKLRPYLNKVVVPDESGIATTELVPLLPDPKRLDRKFLSYYLRSNKFLEWASTQVAGAKMPRVSMPAFWKHEIPLPPLADQHRIVSILEKSHEIRCKRQQAMKLANEFILSVFIDLYGDPTTNPKGWIVHKMSEIIDFKGGHQPPKSTFEYEPKDGYVRLIQIRDFKTDKYKTYIPEDLAKRRFEEDDVMIARYGPPVFQILRGMKGSYNVALMKATPKGKILKGFIYRLLQLPAYHDVVVSNSERTAGQTGVNLELLNNFDVPLPPIKQQKEILERVESMESAVFKMTQFESQTFHLIDSLQARAFSGEL